MNKIKYNFFTKGTKFSFIAYLILKILTEDERIVDLLTRKPQTESVVYSFITEHLLSFPLVPEIFEMRKTLAHDMQSLNLLISTTVTNAYIFIMIKDKQWQKLKYTNFSSNVDESIVCKMMQNKKMCNIVCFIHIISL